MHQTHSLTRIASAVVAARRFVNINGAHAAMPQEAIGISEQPAAVGEAFTALTYYSAPMEAAEALAVGDLVKPATDGSGRAAKADTSGYCGRVIEAASAAGRIAEVRFLEGGSSAAPVSGATTAVAASRASLTTDSTAPLELATGVTYTLEGAALPSSVVLIGPVAGSATLACSGGATINGGTASLTINAGQIFSAIPRASAASAFVVKGS